MIRSHLAGELCLLPNAKLTDLALAQKSAARLANLSAIDTVLTGDGWPVFKQGSAALKRLLET